MNEKRALFQKHLPSIFKIVCKKLQKVIPRGLFDIQQKIILHLARTKIIRASRRVSKTFMVAFYAYLILYFGGAFDYDSHIIFGSPRSEDTDQMWIYFWMFWDAFPLDKAFQRYENFKTNRHAPSNYKKHLTFSENCWIKSGNCQNPEMDDFRKKAFDLAALEEFGNVNYKEDLLNAIIPSLNDDNRLNMLWIIGTVDISVDLGETFNHLFDLGQKEDIESIQSWKILPEDIPSWVYDTEAIEDNKLLMTEDGYLRENRAEPIPRRGRMFKDFNSLTCFRSCPYDSNYPYGIGIDPGRNKPAVVFAQYIDAQVRVFKEINLKNILIDQLLDEIKLIIETEIYTAPLLVGVDKAGNHSNDKVSYTTFEKIKKAFSMARYTNETKLISKLNQVFALKKLVKMNNLIVDTSCVKFLSSLVNATPDINLNTGAINSAGWKKVKGIDDPLDALMYWVINYGPTSELIAGEQNKKMSENKLRNITRQLKMARNGVNTYGMV